MSEKTKIPVVEESTKYENCVDILGSSVNTLDEFLEDDENPEVETNDWRKHWVNMPSFQKSSDTGPWKTVYMHFRSEDDFKDFQKLIGQDMSLKTKSAWHPKLDREANSLMRWIEEE